MRADGVKVKSLSKEQIKDIVASYGKVAGLAKRAGFEMILVHGGHGWLINQFLSPYFNHTELMNTAVVWKTAVVWQVRSDAVQRL